MFIVVFETERRCSLFLYLSLSIEQSVNHLSIYVSMYLCIYLSIYLPGGESFLRISQLYIFRLSQYFMEPEGSLTCSQEPSTDPNPKPHQSSSCHPNPFSLTSVLISLFHLRLGLPSGLLFPSGFPTKTLYALLFSHAPYILCQSLPPRHGHSNYTWRKVEMMFFVMLFCSLL
jgi:hypothetical protein